MEDLNIFSDADKQLQRRALLLKEQNPQISMRQLAENLKISMQKLKQILEPIGMWTPRGLLNYNFPNSTKLYPGRQSTNFIIKQSRDGDVTCTICGIKEWQQIPLINFAQKDHIDGDKKNNHVSNLRILCPNCHSMTTTRFNIKNTHPSRNSSDISKKNMITSLDDILTSTEMQKRFKTQAGKTGASPINATPLDEILEGKRPSYRTSRLVDRLIGAKKKVACCEKCGICEWRGIQIGLFLHGHHKNGNPTDHRLDNIEVLCPNCHIIEHRHETTKNPALIGQQATFLNPNTPDLNLHSPDIQKIINLLKNPNRPRSMAECAKTLNMSFKKFKTIAIKLNLWAPDPIPHRKLNLNDPVVVEQIRIIKKLIAHPDHTKYGLFGLKTAIQKHNMPRKRYLALYDRIISGEADLIN